MIRYLKADQVIQLHNNHPDLGHPVIDRAGLESAVGRPSASFSGQEIFPLLAQKAGALLQGIATNHPFFDGNKRTAWISTQVFLRLNSSPIYVQQHDAADFVESMVAHRLEIHMIAEWISKHFEP